MAFFPFCVLPAYDIFKEDNNKKIISKLNYLKKEEEDNQNIFKKNSAFLFMVV